MTANWKTALATALCVAACSQPGRAQATLPSILEIDTENVVEYLNDITTLSDPSKLGPNPAVTPAASMPPFGRVVGFADIVAVNGQAAKGLVFEWEMAVGASPVPNPGQPIADTRTVAMRYQTFQILQSDGTPVGTIMSLGLQQPGGATVSPPPGAPLAQTSQQYAIVGGTGAFLGARGQQGQEGTPQTVNARLASMAEDPANRRINRGGRVRYILQVIPMSVPQIVATSIGPAVYHLDFSPVTAAKPAKAGEALIAMATGLGPARPGVDSGQPFPPYPANPLQLVNSPVAATVNGQSAAVINAVGWPGLADTYRVDVRVPDGITAGLATIQLSAAWIVGPSVNIPIQ